MKRFILTKFPYIVLFLILWVFVLLSPVSRCILPDSFGFDAQNSLSWKYASTTGFFPLSEVYFPHGLLLYFKDTSFIANMLASLLIPTYVMLVGLFFGKRMKSTVKGFTLALAFFVFIVVFSDLDAFLRYGSAMAFIMFFLLLNRDTRSKSFTIGMINGLLFTAMSDQGLLALATMAIGSTLVCVLERRFPVKKTISSVVRYAAGFFVGFVPLAVYLLFTNGLVGYIVSLLHIPSFASYNESPFLAYALHPQNLLVLLPLFSIILLLSYTYVFRKREPYTRLEISMIFLVVLTILLEERSLVRSIAEGIIFMGPVLWLMFVLHFLRNEKRTQMKIFGLVTGVLGITFFAATLSNITDKLTTLHQQLEYPQQRICTENMVRRRAMFHPGYIALKDVVRQHFPLYIYPADAALYPAFSTPLPPYSNAFHTSPLYAQQQTISWFEDQQTNTVVINTSELEMEGIPYVVRTPKLLSYIFSKYCPTTLVDQYLVLDQCNTAIPSLAKISDIAPKYAQALQHVDLGDIPRKEWQDKRAVFTATIEPLPLNGKGLYIFVQDSAPETILTLASANATMTVTLHDCEDGCIVNPNNLPIFYFEHTITRADVPPSAKIQIVRSPSSFPW